jgi:outer membrane protein TolC
MKKRYSFLATALVAATFVGSEAAAQTEGDTPPTVFLTEAQIRQATLVGNHDLKALAARIRQGEAVARGVAGGFGPTLRGEASLSQDNRQPLNSFQPSGVESRRLGLSVVQPLTSGISLSGGVTLDRTRLSQSEPPNAALPYPETFYQPRLFVAADVDLLRDLHGFISQRRLVKADHDAEGIRGRRGNVTARLLAAASTLLWNIRALDEITQTTGAFLDDLERLEKEVAHKVDRSLAEPGDLYQLKALIGMRRASLVTIDRHRRSLAEGIASFVGSDGPVRVAPQATLAEGEAGIKACEASIMKTPTFSPALSSVYGAYEADIAAADIERDILEREILPDLSLVGSYATNGTDTSLDGSVTETAGTSRNEYYLGLRLSLPLSHDRERSKKGIGEAVAALGRSAYAKRLDDDRALFDSYRDRIGSIGEEIELVKNAVVNGQRQLKDLRLRYRQGRVPLYQLVSEEADVLQFHLRLKELVAERIALVHGFAGRFDRIACGEKE